MKYVRYDHPGRVSEKFNKKELNMMDEKNKRAHRRNQVIEILSVVVFFVLIAGIITTAVLFTKPLVGIDAERGWVRGLLHLARGVIIAVCSALALVLSGYVSLKISRSKTPELSVHEKRRTAMREACGILREFYGFKKPFIVTKCYDSSVPVFRGRDVCLFFDGDNLKITADIFNGFSNGYRDCGCCEFEDGEEQVGMMLLKGKETSVITSGEAFFLLGRRASAFVKKYRKSRKNSKFSDCDELFFKERESE